MSSKATLTDFILRNRFVSHFLFWGTFLLVFTILATLNAGSFSDHLINYVSILPFQMMAAYFLVYYQVPKLLLQKKYARFGISVLASAYVFSVLARLVVIYIVEPRVRENFEQETVWEVLTDPYYLFSVYFPVVYVIVFLMLAVKTIKERFEEKHQIQLLENEKATNELKFLKAQIHPHFLFNTLNNLYALTLAKSDAAPIVVTKLSEMLDYMLYQCNEPSIAIEKEIILLQGYIDLETLRYGTQLQLEFNHQVDIPSTQIAPLILLSFVENAFKHGASGNPLNPKVDVDLQVEKGQLYFKVFNTKPAPNTFKKEDTEKKHIGLANINRQLTLNYPNTHSIEVDDTQDSYCVTLRIDLNE